MKKLKISLLLLLVLTVFAYLISCSSDKEDIAGGGGGGPIQGGNECASVEAKFTANVLPIIQSRCALSDCHGSGSTNGPGELISYAQISGAKSAINDAAVINSRMPKTGGPLTAAQKATIKCWIASGAPNN